MPQKPQNKTQPTTVSAKDFLSKLKNEQQRKDSETLIRLMRKISGKAPVMWGPSIVGFDKVHYKYESGREGDMSALGFSPRSTALTVYLIDGTSKYKELLSKLGSHKTSTVCVYIKRLSDINIAILEKILTLSYQYAMSQYKGTHRADR